MIDAARVTKEPADKNVVKAIRKLAEEAGEIVIATDYDREGELIGLEALEQIVEANPLGIVKAGEGDERGTRCAGRAAPGRARSRGTRR